METFTYGLAIQRKAKSNCEWGQDYAGNRRYASRVCWEAHLQWGDLNSFNIIIVNFNRIIVNFNRIIVNFNRIIVNFNRTISSEAVLSCISCFLPTEVSGTLKTARVCYLMLVLLLSSLWDFFVMGLDSLDFRLASRLRKANQNLSTQVMTMNGEEHCGCHDDELSYERRRIRRIRTPSLV